MSKQTLSFEQYLSALPPERRGEVETVWRVVRENMPNGYVEQIDSKFLSFKADEDWYVALGSQKNYISLYLMPVYIFPDLRAKLEGSGKKLKCGKSCINFKRAEDLPLEAVAEIVAANDGEAYKERVRQVRGEAKRNREASKGKKGR
jgi:uncharacterized protein YdhG (YjbR/CyaY superfamily)